MTKNRKYVMNYVKECSEEKLVEFIDLIQENKKLVDKKCSCND